MKFYFKCTLTLVFISMIVPTVIGQEEQEQSSDSLVFANPEEVMPRFPGCEDMDESIRQSCAQRKMLTFIYSRLKYPGIARENGVEGTVVISYTVSKTGEITDAHIARDIGAGCGKEALRVISLMPNWIPGIQRGENVPVVYNLPIKFSLEKKKKRKKKKPKNKQ